GLRGVQLQGEAASVDVEKAEEEVLHLRKITNQYALQDIFNGDETSLFYQMPPNCTLATMACSGRKGDKTHMSYMLTTNADGSEWLKPLVFGHSKQPCCFQHKTPQSLGFDYHFNKKAWMTGVIFQ
ncbi:DDE-domain-containing protein, partial [Dacryopinax primogenitus]